jgi:hypothetical protein
MFHCSKTCEFSEANRDVKKPELFHIAYWLMFICESGVEYVLGMNERFPLTLRSYTEMRQQCATSRIVVLNVLLFD